MKHECRITVLETKCFTEYQEKYLADPKSGPCPFFKKGDTFLLKRTPQQDDFYHLMNGRFCGEAWDAVSRYVYAALQGGSIMKAMQCKTADELIALAKSGGYEITKEEAEAYMAELADYALDGEKLQVIAGGTGSYDARRPKR